MTNPFKFAVWLLVLSHIAFAIISSSPEVLSNYLAGAMTVFFYLVGYVFDEEEDDYLE